jgi:hypothetical protein
VPTERLKGSFTEDPSWRILGLDSRATSLSSLFADEPRHGQVRDDRRISTPVRRGLWIVSPNAQGQFSERVFRLGDQKKGFTWNLIDRYKRTLERLKTRGAMTQGVKHQSVDFVRRLERIQQKLYVKASRPRPRDRIHHDMILPILRPRGREWRGSIPFPTCRYLLLPYRVIRAPIALISSIDAT